MRTASTTVHRVVSALFATALIVAAGSSAAADDGNPYPLLPGEPDPKPATAGSPDVIGAAIDWAKFGKEPDANKVVDAAITAISVGYPPAGAALGIAKGLIGALGGGGPDPVAEALKIMDQRISALEKNVQALADGLNAVRDHVFEFENRMRIGELQRRKDELSKLKNRLQVLRSGTASAIEKSTFVDDVVKLAARYRPETSFDDDVWKWSDLHVYTNTMTKKMDSHKMAPDFKSLPMLESYVNALVLLMAAIQYEHLEPADAIRKYHDELMKHVQLLSVRPYWLEGMAEPKTLAENLMSRVTCTVRGGSKYAERNGACYAYDAQCEDVLGRRSSRVDSGIGQWYQQPGSLCSMPVGLPRPMRDDERATLEARWEARQDGVEYGTQAYSTYVSHTGFQVAREEELRNYYGLETMLLLADRVYKLASTGSLVDPPSPRFDHTYWDKEYIYGVRPNGELVWQGHLIGEDRNGPKNDPFRVRANDRFSGTTVTQRGTEVGTTIGARSRVSATSAGIQTGVAGRAGSDTPAGGGGSGPATSVSRASQQMNARIASLPQAQPDYPIIHRWEGPKVVGTGWQNFREIIPAAMTSVTPTAAGASFYAITNDGYLNWYRHDGFVYGEPRWKGAVTVSGGWQNYTKIIPAGDGVVYAIGADGALRWNRQEDVADPGPMAPSVERTPGTLSKSRIGAGSRVTGPASSTLRAGALSGVAGVSTSSNVLPPARWLGPTIVSNNWGHFVHVFSTGEGVIYAVDPQGTLWWYRHKGYLTGSNEWQGPVQVSSGWAGFKKVFSPSEGYIYALQQNGELVWYQHLGYLDGSARWRGPTSLGLEWGDFQFVFSAMQGTPQAPIVR